jgi:polar amino acid transport system permease protein
MLRLLFITQDNQGDRVTPAAAVVSWLTAALAVSLLFWFAFSQARFGWGWEAVFAYREKFLDGWLMTVMVSTISLVISLAVGVAIALAQRVRFLPLRYLARLFMEILRGTPFLVQILIFFYVIAEAFGIHNRYVAGIAILAMFSGAYISEIIRSGIESVSETQLESARAIGFTRFQILPVRYCLLWRASLRHSSRIPLSCRSFRSVSLPSVRRK